MAIYASSSGENYEPIPAGNYFARCYMMIHIGTVTGSYGPKNMIRIGWEFPDDLKVFDAAKGPQPMAISQEYALSMSPKSNLCKMLESWRGQGFTPEQRKKFDVTALLGKVCMINVIHKPAEADPTRIYANIGSISAVPKGSKVKAQVNPMINLSYDNWNQEVFDNLPEYFKSKMVLTPEYAEMKKPGSSAGHDMTMNSGPDDDLPF